MIQFHRGIHTEPSTIPTTKGSDSSVRGILDRDTETDLSSLDADRAESPDHKDCVGSSLSSSTASVYEDAPERLERSFQDIQGIQGFGAQFPTWLEGEWPTQLAIEDVQVCVGRQDRHSLDEERRYGSNGFIEGMEDIDSSRKTYRLPIPGEAGGRKESGEQEVGGSAVIAPSVHPRNQNETAHHHCTLQTVRQSIEMTTTTHGGATTIHTTDSSNTTNSEFPSRNISIFHVRLRRKVVSSILGAFLFLTIVATSWDIARTETSTLPPAIGGIFVGLVLVGMMMWSMGCDFVQIVGVGALFLTAATLVVPFLQQPNS